MNVNIEIIDINAYLIRRYEDLMGVGWFLYM